MTQEDLGNLKDRAQAYTDEISADLSAQRNTSSIKTAGFQRADVFVDFTRDVVDEISIQHISNTYVEQAKDDAALPIIALEDVVYRKVVSASSKFKFSVDLNSEYTQFIFDSLSAVVGTVVFTGTGLDDGTSGGTFSGSAPKDYIVEIDATGTPDTFRWSDDGGASWTTGVSITGAAQVLSDGVTIEFAATTGHTVTDQWSFGAGYGSASDTITVDVTLR